MKKLSIVLLAGLGGTAQANAFLLNEFDARAVGRGNATTATETNASAIFYNIGGLAVYDGTQATVGGSVIQPSGSFTDTAGLKTSTTTSGQAVPGVFGSTRLNDLVAVGVGFYTPFGLAVRWPEGTEPATVSQFVSLHTFFITPSVGVNLGSYVPGLTVGGGIDLVPATIELRRDVPFGTVLGSTHLGGNAFGFGGRIGAMYRPAWLKELSLGLMWRSEVKEDFTGNADFDAPAPFRALLPPDGNATTSISLPQSIHAGAAYRPFENLELEADVIWTQWSEFHQLDIQVPTPANGTMTIPLPQNYQNETTVRIGIEWGVPTIRSAFRVGYIYDPTPIPPTTLTPLLPDITRNDLTIGGSYSLLDYTAHVGLLWVLPHNRTTSDTPNMPEVKGTYDVSAFVLSLSFSGKFGK